MKDKIIEEAGSFAKKSAEEITSEVTGVLKVIKYIGYAIVALIFSTITYMIAG